MKTHTWPSLHGPTLHERVGPGAGCPEGARFDSELGWICPKKPPQSQKTTLEEVRADYARAIGDLVHERTLAHMARTGTRDYAAALRQVIADDPALARKYLFGEPL